MAKPGGLLNSIWAGDQKYVFQLTLALSNIKMVASIKMAWLYMKHSGGCYEDEKPLSSCVISHSYPKK